MLSKPNRIGLALLAACFAAGTNAAEAAKPEPWQIGFQPAATPVMEEIIAFNDMVFPIIVVIAAFVLALMIYVFVKFNARSNPTPSRVSHNTFLEFAWTVVPIIILVVIAIPSIRLLYYSDTTPEAGLTIKAIGHQWYWSYEYPDNGAFVFDSVMVEDDALQPGQLRLLETDNHVVVPVGTVVRVLISSEDVIHAWAIPAFGVKKDAVPGRTTEIWFQATLEGTYYGQCSELCGVNHGFMPITVDVVSPAAFQAWLTEAQTKFAESMPAAEFTVGVASATTSAVP
ncbi:MAG: cytochrome c oxidase subunit II [Alphaproteobacteria bacterium]|nr:cytochrome c oxidase subunit II [Alphaproteobacteria bacterium]